MSIAHLADLPVSGGSDTQATAAAQIYSGVATSRTQPRVTPPLPFEVEEFDSQIPEENWRYRQGMPETLDFPSVRD
jgi:hypothetical protein